MRYTASFSFWACAERFCADHHCWMLSLPGTGLWHKLQSFLHATVTFFNDGEGPKEHTLYTIASVLLLQVFLGYIKTMSSVGLPLKTSLFCFFCATILPSSPPPLLFFMSKQVQDSSFSRYKCSFGRSRG